MKRNFLLLILIIIPSLFFSQDKNTPTYTITGKIIDAKTKKPLEYATIVFKSTSTKETTCGGVSNARGKFSIDVLEGTYKASVEFISYKSKVLNISTINRNLNIGTIELEIDTEYLETVEITGEKKAIEIKPNKITINVDKDVAVNGGTVIDILNNNPIVNVDPSGDIKINGVNSPTILINGKISSLTKTDVLKTIPTNSIEKIDILPTAGAKFKASSTGIINIILKKGKDEGLNASATASGGYKDYYGGLVTINNKSKNLNFYTNASYSHRNPITISNAKNEYFTNGNTDSFLYELSENDSKDNVFYSTIGFDFYISEKSTLSTSINYTNVNNNSTTYTVSDFYNSNFVLTDSNERTHLGDFNDEIVEFVTDFEQNFEKEGQKITASLTYSRDKETYNNVITNTNNSFTDEEYVEKNTMKNTIFDVKYSSPIGENSSYTIGYYGEFGNIPFTYTGTSTTNNLDYSEDINAGFIEFENQSDTFYYGLGLRAEFTSLSVFYESTSTSQNKQYDNLFPSVYLEYSIRDNQSVSLSYSKSIQTPNYLRLQPFEQRFSETSSYVGNENLNPVFIHSLSATYSYSKDNLMLYTTAFFNIFDDYWQDVTYETGEFVGGIPKILTTPLNIGKVNYYGVNVTATYKTSNYINFTGNINLYNFDQSGIFEITNLNNDLIVQDFNFASFNGSFSLSTQIKLPNLFNFQTKIVHQLESKGPVSVRKARTYASIAINKDLFDKQASVSLVSSDLFNTHKTNRDRFDDGYFSISEIKQKYPNILLSFTYRFNQSKKDRKIDFDKKLKKPEY